MSVKYLIPLVLFLGLGITLLVLPGKKTYTEMNPADLLEQITSVSRFTTPDEIAARIIEKDPALLLVDVREQEEFVRFSLPGAVNIPLADLLAPDNQEIISQEGMEIVFYSNGDIPADQAWIICRRKGISNIYVMKGGLNEWFNDFFVNTPPPESAPASEHELFQFRNGVRQYLTGGEIPSSKQDAGEPVPVKPRSKKSAAEGGC